MAFSRTVCYTVGMETRYVVYMLSCADGSLYTGVTVDLARRFLAHHDRTKAGAKYTHGFGAVAVAAAWQAADKTAAYRLEYYIKRLTRAQKCALIETDDFAALSRRGVDAAAYVRIPDAMLPVPSD